VIQTLTIKPAVCTNYCIGGGVGREHAESMRGINRFLPGHILCGDHRRHCFHRLEWVVARSARVKRPAKPRCPCTHKTPSHVRFLAPDIEPTSPNDRVSVTIKRSWAAAAFAEFPGTPYGTGYTTMPTVNLTGECSEAGRISSVGGRIGGRISSVGTSVGSTIDPANVPTGGCRILCISV